ncbi:hypothetical protein PYJP_06860 [Pyrofollis japonicus]|nr:hypothetical protein PYJP_06860 [Pyrofollis japonicus]
MISKDGFVIDAVIPGGEEIDPDALAAMIITVYGASERVGSELKLGNLDMVMLEFANNYVLLEDLGDAVFTVIADKRAYLGRIRYEMKKQKERIKAAL